MTVSHIEIKDTENLIEIETMMQNLPAEEIAFANWLEFPEKPIVTFKIAHNQTHLFLKYDVEEHEVLAKTEVDNGKVCTDSCVEFFISFQDSPYYYNAEFSCIGKTLFGYRKERKDVIYADEDVLKSIKRYSSLGAIPFERKKGYTKWSLLLVIPIAAFWKSDLASFANLNAQANFYKCGDNLTKPHYLSWSPIEYPTPNFHLPQFFAQLDFE